MPDNDLRATILTQAALINRRNRENGYIPIEGDKWRCHDCDKQSVESVAAYTLYCDSYKGFGDAKCACGEHHLMLYCVKCIHARLEAIQHRRPNHNSIVGVVNLDVSIGRVTTT